LKIFQGLGGSLNPSAGYLKTAVRCDTAAKDKVKGDGTVHRLFHKYSDTSVRLVHAILSISALNFFVIPAVQQTT
jgi:hypothetical protein